MSAFFLLFALSFFPLLAQGSANCFIKPLVQGSNFIHSGLLEGQIGLLINRHSHLTEANRIELTFALELQEQLIQKEIEAVYGMASQMPLTTETQSILKLILNAKQQLEGWKSELEARRNWAIITSNSPPVEEVLKYVDITRLNQSGSRADYIKLCMKRGFFFWSHPYSLEEYQNRFLYYAYQVLSEGRRLAQVFEEQRDMPLQEPMRQGVKTRHLGSEDYTYDNIQQFFTRDGVHFSEASDIGKTSEGVTIQAQISNPILFEGKKAIIGKIINKETGAKAYRVYYVSTTSAIFRLLPAINDMNVFKNLPGYDKNLGEFALAPSPVLQSLMAQQLTKAPSPIEIGQDLVSALVHHNRDEIDRQNYKQHDTLNLEFSTYVRHLFPRDLSRPLEAKRGKLRFANPETLMLPEEQRADFSQVPLIQYEMESPIYGELNAMVYLSQDKTLQFTLMRQKSTGRIWLAQVSDPQAPVNEFGVPSVSINAHEFTIPLWEYEDQIPSSPRSFKGPSHPDDSDYASSWEYIKRIPLIRNWYLANGLQIPE